MRFLWHYIMYLTLHLYDVLTSCQHITPFWYVSHILFQKSWILWTMYSPSAEIQINTPPPLELASDSNSIPFMPSRRGRWQRSPCSSPKWWSDDTQIMDPEYLMEWFKWCCESPPPLYELFFPFPLMNCQTPLPLWIIWPPFPLELATDSSSSHIGVILWCRLWKGGCQRPSLPEFCHGGEMSEADAHPELWGQRIPGEISSRVSNICSSFFYYNPRFIRTNFYLVYT